MFQAFVNAVAAREDRPTVVGAKFRLPSLVWHPPASPPGVMA